MLLAVDIGNTNIKIGVFDGESLIDKITIPTDRKASASSLNDALAAQLPPNIASAVICSVVPEALVPVKELMSSHLAFSVRVIENTDELGITVNYFPIEAAGTDRLVNASAAAAIYGVPTIVCSFGTATTIDLVDSERRLIGGLIAPGLDTLPKALHIAAPLLPEVELAAPKSVLQNTTEGSLRSGIVNGYVEMVSGLIRRIKNEAGGDIRVIATGGRAMLVNENTDIIDIVDEVLILKGLQRFAIS